MEKATDTIKSLALSYNINIDSLYYLSSKKKYSINKIKKIVFEEKYGKGCHATNYYNYYLPRFINSKIHFRRLKNDFFTDYELSDQLNLSIVELIWDRIMDLYLKITWNW